MTRGALVHEWLAPHGGSENVFEQIALTFPDADLYCLWNDAPTRFDGRAVRETWLARTPLRRSKALALPFMPLAWRGLPGGPYDWALVSTHALSHHVSFAATTPDFRKFLYVHTPARYLWAPDLDVRGAGPLARAAAGPLRALDRRRSTEASAVVANSEFVRERVQHAWQRDCEVIYPPVDVETIVAVADWRTRLSAAESEVLAGLPSGFVLGASRFIPYKRLDLVVRAAEIAGRPVVLAGAGPEEAALRRLAAGASVPVHFVIAPANPLLYALYQRASVFVFPPIEDFGIMPIECMAAGTPVIVRAEGGASEGVVRCGGGAVLGGLSPADWRDAFDQLATIDRDQMRRSALQFGRARFQRELRSWLAHQLSS